MYEVRKNKEGENMTCKKQVLINGRKIPFCNGDIMKICECNMPLEILGTKARCPKCKKEVDITI